MTGKLIHPLLNRIINNGGILSMHSEKFEAEKRAAFAAGVEASAKVADRFNNPAFVGAITGTPYGKVPVAAEAIASAIRALRWEPKAQ